MGVEYHAGFFQHLVDITRTIGVIPRAPTMYRTCFDLITSYYLLITSRCSKHFYCWNYLSTLVVGWTWLLPQTSCGLQRLRLKPKPALDVYEPLFTACGCLINISCKTQWASILDGPTHNICTEKVEPRWNFTLDILMMSIVSCHLICAGACRDCVMWVSFPDLWPITAHCNCSLPSQTMWCDRAFWVTEGLAYLLTLIEIIESPVKAGRGLYAPMLMEVCSTYQNQYCFISHVAGSTKLRME